MVRVGIFQGESAFTNRLWKKRGRSKNWWSISMHQIQQVKGKICVIGYLQNSFDFLGISDSIPIEIR